MQATPPPPDSATLSEFRLTDPHFIIETPIATVWQVTRKNGGKAALKTYKDGDMRDEAPGFDLLAAQSGQGAALIFERTDTAVLMEWLDGPTLGDLVRDGQDDEASAALVDTANRLHQMSAAPIAGLDPLENRFQSLFNASFAAACPPDAAATLQNATGLAATLIASQTNKRPLHGDFHHDNVKGSTRGYLAFDAKGVFGDRHFELANAFWNPFDAPIDIRTAETILRRATIWAAGFQTDEQSLLQWAAAYTALSLSWTYKGTFGPEVTEHTSYLNTLFSLIEAT